MARAPETGYYFEPISERLALVVEGSPFPTDDHWAYVGAPPEMGEELARLECANRWPGVDPDGLSVELDTDFERMVAELERQQQAAADAAADPFIGPGGGEIPFDVNLLLEQAESLRQMAAQMAVPDARELERAAEEAGASTVGEAIARAHRKDE